MTAGASAVLMVIGGGTAAIAALTEDEPRIVTATGGNRAVAAAAPPPPTGTDAPSPPATSGLGELAGPAADQAGPPVGERAFRRTSDEADRTATRAPRATTPAPAPPADPAPAPARYQPTVTSRTVVETREIPYRTRLIRDPDLPRGRKRVQTEGVPGEQTLRWLVTYSDGRPTDRRLVEATVTREPQHRVVAFGTRRSKGDRECRSGSDHCFPVRRSAACPDPGVTTERVDLLTSEDLKALELVCP